MNKENDNSTVDQAEIKALKRALGQGIRERRVKMGWTQRELARAALGSEDQDSTIAAYENARRLPPLNVIIRIAKVLGDRRGSVDRLLGLPREGLTRDEEDLLAVYRPIRHPVYRRIARDAIRALQEADRELPPSARAPE